MLNFLITRSFQLKSIVKANNTLSGFFGDPTVSTVVHVLLRLYTLVFMGWCLMPFALLKFDRYWGAFSNVYHVGSLTFLLWPVVYAPILRLVFRKSKKEEKERTE